MAAPIALTVKASFNCPTATCNQRFECHFILGHLTSEAGDIPQPKNRSTTKCVMCGVVLMVAPLREPVVLRISSPPSAV